jgi:glycosyltransferase involved in cell wall biosynthesis
MVLNRADLGRFREVISQKPANVQIYERIHFQEMDRLFKEAMVLINTSVFEGFPYTFLQAGKFGVPILSLEVDPDGFIQRYHCGKVAMGNKARLLEGLQELIGNPDLWRTCSKNIRDYVESRHELNSVVKQLDGIFRELMKNAA